jgi:exopolyphosphatase / guanosine-5'-triphosphate,3'-diphosphate pyrophosphatase
VSRRGACIDIGSNTTRLLVAELEPAGTLRVLAEDRVFTRIGAALIAGDTIPAAKCDEVAEVVAAQLGVAEAHRIDRVVGVATAAVRQAANGAALVDCVRERTGLQLTVLSGGEEARLAFAGARRMLGEAPPAPLGVLDVGGGSSEVVIGDARGEVVWWTSLPVGSGGLAARYLSGDPPAPAELAAARRKVQTVLRDVEWSGPAPAHTLAVGGSATSLARVVGPRLDSDALGVALGVVCETPAAAVAARFGIDPQRARLLPAGLLVLEALGRRLGGPVEVGRGGIREGVLLEALAS